MFYIVLITVFMAIVLGVIGAVCALGQWLAVKLQSRAMVWAVPIFVHLALLAEIVREHWEFSGSVAAASGGAGAAGAAGLLGAYGSVALSGVISLYLVPFWLRRTERSAGSSNAMSHFVASLGQWRSGKMRMSMLTDRTPSSVRLS